VSKRRSFEVPGIEHENPIPAATRIGSLIMSSGIFPRDPATGKAPDGLEEQCAVLFVNIRRVVECAGGTTEDIIKITLWAKDRRAKALVNKEWLAMFPDPHSRPARHTIVYDELPGNMMIQCELTAVVGS
jgi:enamine deaminase RidA (YjgF/YER057c/UK114 family)